MTIYMLTDEDVRCPSCGSTVIRMRDYLLCSKCGVDCPDAGSRFDEYWTRGDESQVMDEMDDFFYEKYPQFSS